MPIRFACEHCYQMLSISSRKIGKRLHCPRCHQSLTVPDEAGAAESIAIRKAARAKSATPPPLPSTSGPTIPGTSPEMESLLGGAPEEPTAEYIVYDEADLLYDSERNEGPFDPTKVAVPRLVIYVQGVLLVLVAAAAFGLGFFSAGGPRGGPATTENRPSTLHGSLKQGTAPVAGAVVIVLPDLGDRALPTAAKMTAKNLFPEGSSTTFGEGLASVRELGGDAQLTDNGGQFHLQVAAPGKFVVLTLSSPIKGAAAAEAGHLAELANYFQEPKELLRDRKYTLTSITLEGDRELLLKL